MNLIDTHTHLYWDSYREDLDQVIKRSIDSGVTTIINVGVDVNLSKKAAEQVKSTLSKIPGFLTYSTIGIHPHEAYRYIGNPDVSIHDDIGELEQIYKQSLPSADAEGQTPPSQIVAVGECGLDYKDVDEQNKKLQLPLFQTQIDLAKKLNLPLLVHCRDDRSQKPENSEAWDGVLNMVGTHPTILHCYSGLLKTTEKVLASSTLIVSFAGTITYPKNDYLREAAKMIPLDRIVLETDCPFLPPQSKRGQRNEPSAVLEIAKLIADLKGVSLDTVASKTTENAHRILRIK